MAGGDSPPPCYSSFAYSAYLRSSLWKAQAAQEVLKAGHREPGSNLGSAAIQGEQSGRSSWDFRSHKKADSWSLRPA